MYGQPSIHTSPKKPPRKKAATPKLDVAQEAVRERIENNEPVDRHGLAKELDISHWTVEMARQRELGRREGLDEQLDPAFIDSLKPADKKRFDKAVAAEVERCLIEERRALHEEYSGYIKWMNDKNERAERILNSHKGLISREKFRKIKACLHPDHNTFVFAAEAIQIFSELEDILVKPEEPVKVGPAFPVSVADMMARRNARKRR